MVDPADSPAIAIPFLMLPSGDENAADVAKWESQFGTAATSASGASNAENKQVVWFKDQSHGWMAARGDLADDKVLAAYRKGYSILSEWFRSKL